MNLFRLSRGRRTPSLLPNYIILTLLVLFSLGPLLTLFFNSLKSTPEVGRNPLGPPVEQIRWQNYPEAWDKGNYSVTTRNSAIITAGTVAGVLLIAGMAAYSLGRLVPPGADVLTMYFLVGISMPAQLFLVPLFFLWHRLGLIDNLLGVILIYWAVLSPFATFLLRSFMVAIPQDFEDAARIDGASEWQVFWRVIIPITWPGFLTVGLVTGLAAWNEFLFAVTFLHSPDMKPVATSLYAFTLRFTQDWGLTSAASVMMIMPVIILFLLLQRQFIEGLTQGGLKA
jgi:raffinose/stachyose/melibiose transport system permease protein